MTEVSNLFGSLDTATLGKSIESGTYECELTSVKTWHQKDKDSLINFGTGKDSIIFEWTVSDETSDFYGETIQQWYSIFPGLDTNAFAGLSGPDKLTVKKSINWLNMQLKNIGMTPDEIAVMSMDSIKEREGITRFLDITVTPGEDGKNGFTKVRKISAADDDSSSRGFGF